MLLLISGLERNREEGVEKKDRKKKDCFASGAAPQLRWLVGHRAGTGQLVGEGGGAGQNSRERAEPLSLEKREERERALKNE